MREIGSEFSAEFLESTEVKKRLFISKIDKGEFVFSGRTAIETVLMNESSIHKALLPSYCCDSMIEPFRKSGIEVEFYTVNYTESITIDLNVESDVDCVLWCNYFGFNISMPDLSAFIDRGGIVIEDITHSLYSKKQFHEQSQYLVASLRKWEPLLCGGYCSARGKRLINIPHDRPTEWFLRKKKEAMLLKNKYITGENNISKPEFLQMYKAANEWLSDNYSNLAIDEYSKTYLRCVDYANHRKRRIDNAIVLYNGLKKHSDIEFLFDIYDMDCPLFVPIIIKNGKRDELRKKLIANEIYCPVHWPHPNAECDSNLYDIELSLICDHRYNETDMQRIINVLCENNGEE